MKLSLIKLFTISFISIFIINCTTSESPLEEPVNPISTLVTYNKNVKTIIDNNCISCHISGGQAGFLPLINYTQVKNSAERGSLISRMNSITAPMPKSGLLPAQTRAVIDKWKEDGFLEK
ncbi:hypothetical protein [Polaribacter tangerinus]|uniref:hypothetical protein n=1 Tax=Polaribacter tangerinus TaxID=1920034 RepID=UPI000B4A74ED|nr:hypothetical protein [Polaribacter tangerinus]